MACALFREKERRREFWLVIDLCLWAGYLVGGERGVKGNSVVLDGPESACRCEGHGIEGQVLSVFALAADTHGVEG